MARFGIAQSVAPPSVPADPCQWYPLHPACRRLKTSFRSSDTCVPVLRDDGVTYHQYVTELTYLLFLKMAKETSQGVANGKQPQDLLPKGYRWDDLAKQDGVKLLEDYRKLLLHLGSHGSGRVQQIYANASTTIRQARNLQTLVNAIDSLDWYSAKSEGLGALYEGLLEKNAEETKSGAGQYFTPRAPIESTVHLIKQQPGELASRSGRGWGAARGVY